MHKPQPRVREHGGLESATVSGAACVVIRRGSKVDVVKFVEAGQTETFGGSDDSIFQVSVFPPVVDKKCKEPGDYDFKAGVLCMKCSGAGDTDYGQKTGIACCI